MNIFKIMMLNSILIIFPILMYLIYLFTNINISEKKKNMYNNLSIISSLYLVYTFCDMNNYLIGYLLFTTIAIISYIQNKYLLYIIINILILIIFPKYIYLIIINIIISIIIKNKNNIVKVELLTFINVIIYLLLLRNINMNIITLIINYIFMNNIIYLLYKIGVDILSTHMEFKKLQNEKQIRLSLFKITHEIKNPIAVCKGYLDMLNVNDSTQVNKYIPIIKSEIERLLSMLQDYLLLNKSNMDLDIMDLNILIEENIDKLEPLINSKSINLNTKLIDDEVFINGDYNRLNQVIINILKNSIEAINTNGIINIITKVNNNKFIVVVEDNGIGINKDIINKIKEPFFTTKSRGSGLGVSLIYDIVEAHNGSVEYESKSGKGTKVILKFPLYE